MSYLNPVDENGKKIPVAKWDEDTKAHIANNIADAQRRNRTMNVPLDYAAIKFGRSLKVSEFDGLPTDAECDAALKSK